MPLFGFYCKKCSTLSEILVFGQQTPQCPQCGSSALEKQLSHFAAVSSQPASPCDGCPGTAPRAHSCPSGGCGCH